MLLELLTLFKNFVLRIATVCSADTQLNIPRQMSTTSCGLVSKTFLKVLFITQFKLLNCDFRAGLQTIQTVAAAKNNTRVGLARSMASAGTRAYNGGLGRSPLLGSRGAEPPVGGQGAKPPEADGILVLEHTFCALPEAFYTLVSYSLPTVPRKQN